MIGARFSLFPMCEEFVSVITKAIEGIDHLPLRREVDPVSTFLSGDESSLFLALRESFSRAGVAGGHVVMSLTLSRGCPGEPDGDECEPTAQGAQAAEEMTTKSGAPDEAAERSPDPEVACQFSLYPMGTSAYMDAIYDQITSAKQNAAVAVTPQHFCTRLEGRLSDVLGELRRTFDATAHVTPHVVIHATLSTGSPTDAGTLVRLNNPRQREEG